MSTYRTERAAALLLAGALGALAYGCSGGDVKPDSAGSTSGGQPDAGIGGQPPGDDAGPPDSGPPPPPPDPSDQVFDPTQLHTIDIVVDLQYWDQLDNDSENRVPCTVKFNSKVLENSGCRKKGGYGSVQPLSGKPGFSVKFNEFEEGQDLNGLTRILFNNAVQDPGFLNEHIGYEVYRRAGIPAARTAHGVLRLNGETKGIYVIAEAFDKKFLARHFGEENKQGNLYEGPAFVDFVTDVAGMDLKDEVEEMRSRDDLIALSKIVQTASDAELAEALKPKLDLDGFIKGFAIDAIAHHWDGYSFLIINNYYMYNNPATGKFLFMPHGMDQLFQDVNFDVDTWPKGRLSQRVRTIPALDAQFHDSIVSVLQTAWDVPYLLKRIDQVTAIIATNTNMDPAAVNDIASYEAHVNGTRTAVAYRKSILLGEPLGECGNGVQEFNETCDDGNKVTGDGCSSACFVENCTSATNGGSKYLICPDAKSAFDARLECAAYGGALAVPNSAAENNWMKSTAFGVAGQNYWIGVDDEKSEGSYVKPDGSPVTFFDWADTQPNGGANQNCVEVQFDVNGWNDKACGELYGAICRLP
jgi:cysteine-rich repeat protein